MTPSEPETLPAIPSRVAALTLTVASAVAYGCAFPTTAWRPLAWVALTPWLWALRGASRRRALGLGWLWSVVAAYTVGDWFAPSFAQYYQQPLALGVLFFVAVSTVTAGPYYTAFALLYRRLVRRPGALLPVVAGATWVACEFARARLLEIANPWALSGYSQIGMDRVVQVADFSSVYGIAFLLGTVNAAVAELALAAGRRRSLTEPLRGLALVALLVAAALAYGELRLRTISDPIGEPPVRFAMIQANHDLGSLWRPEFYGANLGTYVDLTREILPKQPAIVVWPENALSFLLEKEPAYRAIVAGSVEPSRPQLIVGGPRFAPGPPPRYFNSMFRLAPDGSVAQVYDKQRLVPFGEYFPFPALSALRRRPADVREFSPGEHGAPLETRAGPAGVTICNEAMFPEIARSRVLDGATYLLDPANDTWLTEKFSAQQFEMVTLRAVEERRWIVRASTAGPSAIVDPLGRPRLRTEFFTRAAVTGDIVPRTDLTPYARVGDLFAWICTLIAGIGWVRARRA